jgi:putative membrane protein
MIGTPTDHLANQRTFLAWVRTAITIMAFGFVVARFGLFLRISTGFGAPSSSAVTQETGVFLVLAGTALLGVATIEFDRVRRGLLARRFAPELRLELVLAGILAAVGVGLAIYLLGTP